ncbi:hypothetical protein MATR_22780 [Marivirga tractuosa]|uniref:DUF4174 domain-containing protein n=1 Tax=Marivirga tractuosa (strain ATCC 23168 / DSM 4126 / NBRC 15989 / NCIMB 1408 / VKM B-1430 / H-43) TaxID=643867 RepID=E4TVH7_MARTH|nr:DUF4174 domain-containing protein [Marivirga tractuosa]ADR20109.1 hypothetical protein Ftrac_0096 [Marivirga tractuosa DSM 4126]BDD15453.1 hypothetical protein MATR_22780 [Marivirga tractuosa]
MSCAQAQITSLDDFQWKNRLLIIYTADQKSTQLDKQLAEITRNKEGYNERDLKVIILKNQKVEIWNSNKNHLLDFHQIIKELNIEEKQPLQNLLIGKDGGVKLKSNSTISNEKLFRIIDAMPMRQREMRDGN